MRDLVSKTPCACGPITHGGDSKINRESENEICGVCAGFGGGLWYDL